MPIRVQYPLKMTMWYGTDINLFLTVNIVDKILPLIVYLRFLVPIYLEIVPLDSCKVL